MRFVLFGAGFWARYQLAGWREIPGFECVAVCDPDAEKAVRFAEAHGVPQHYADPEAAMEHDGAQFVDVVSSIPTHAPLVERATERGLRAVVQKPMADSLEAARRLVGLAPDLLVNENWRWQPPLRAAIERVRAGAVGRPFRATWTMISGFDVYRNQPALHDLPRFILSDLGVHVLDTARCLLGEAERVHCVTHRVLRENRGEDVATVLLDHGDATSVVSMAYVRTPLERECFPQTLLLVEGTEGSLEVTPDYGLRVTTRAGTVAERVEVPNYGWADPAYGVVHASIVACQRNLAADLRGEAKAETTGEDNLRTLELVEAAYAAAERKP